MLYEQVYTLILYTHQANRAVGVYIYCILFLCIEHSLVYVYSNMLWSYGVRSPYFLESSKYLICTRK